MLKIYNTLTRKKEDFIPAKTEKIRMFVCGPTVYDHIHIGNARTFVVFDVIAKYLRQQGYNLDYIMNITDIDDKIISKAKELKKDPLEYAEEFEQKFLDDIKYIGVDSPRYEQATDYIPQIISQVKRLRDKEHAYLIEDDGWYFDLSTFSNYGKLSGRTASMADDGVSRIDENENKRNKGDFCLWKFSKDGEPAWDFETGKYLGLSDNSPAFSRSSAGRPGWHIEDTAITETNFGEQYDIHGGARDLIFPHHEAEIAQMESISGKVPFVKYWLHSGFVEFKSAKMSKSLDNFTLLSELTNKYTKEELRHYLLSAHYRSPLEFSEYSLKQSRSTIKGIIELLYKLELVINSTLTPVISSSEFNFEKEWELFDLAIQDDFDTPKAFAINFFITGFANVRFDKKSLDKKQAIRIKDFLNHLNDIFEIFPRLKPIPDEIKKLVQERDELRNNSQFSASDQIRDDLANKGYQIKDTLYGTMAMPANLYSSSRES